MQLELASGGGRLLGNRGTRRNGCRRSSGQGCALDEEPATIQ
jgi:hypothetical protein